MPIYQKFNKRTKAWVKYKTTRRGSRILNVKEKEPSKPFKNINKKR